MAAIAARCGFGTAETMRRSFIRRVGISPDQYRKAFCLTLGRTPMTRMHLWPTPALPRWTWSARTRCCETRARPGAVRGSGAGRATPHWLTLPALKAFGAIPVADERIVHQDNIVTSAGVSAGLDLALWLAGQLGGEARQA